MSGRGAYFEAPFVAPGHHLSFAPLTSGPAAPIVRATGADVRRFLKRGDGHGRFPRSAAAVRSRRFHRTGQRRRLGLCPVRYRARCSRATSGLPLLAPLRASSASSASSCATSKRTRRRGPGSRRTSPGSSARSGGRFCGPRRLGGHADARPHPHRHPVASRSGSSPGSGSSTASSGATSTTRTASRSRAFRRGRRRAPSAHAVRHRRAASPRGALLVEERVGRVDPRHVRIARAAQHARALA